MKNLFFAGVMCCGVLTCSPLGAADVSGNWAIKGAIAGVDVDIHCVFTQETSKLSGKCTQTGGTEVEAAGTVDEKVTFAYDTLYEGTMYHVIYTAKLESDIAMKGAIEAGGEAGEFTGTKE